MAAQVSLLLGYITAKELNFLPVSFLNEYQTLIALEVGDLFDDSIKRVQRISRIRLPGPVS